MAFAAWQAFVRRNAGLALITIGFACQWIAWARIDRAAFQYHYYTSLPFVFLALAYFLAELWHGASRRTWLLARLAAAAAVLAPTTLWLFHRPLCGFVRVLDVNPDSQACPTLIPDFVLTGRALAIAVVVGIGVLLLVRLLLSLAAETDEHDGRPSAGARPRQPARDRRPHRRRGEPGLHRRLRVRRRHGRSSRRPGWPVEPIALVVTIALLPIAAFVATARDARRFVAGRRRRDRRLVHRLVSELRRVAAAERPRRTPTRASCRPTSTRSSSRSARSIGASPGRPSSIPGRRSSS